MSQLQVQSSLERLQSLLRAVVSHTLDLIIISIPTIAILVHCFRNEINSNLTQGKIAVVANLLVSSVDEAIYIVLLWTALGLALTLRIALRVRIHWIVLSAVLILVLLSTTIAEAAGQIGSDSVGELARSNWREAMTYCLQSLQTIDVSPKFLAVVAAPITVFLVSFVFVKLKVYRPNELILRISVLVTLISLAVCVSLDAASLFRDRTSFSTYRLNLEFNTETHAADFVRQRRPPNVLIYIGESSERRWLYRELQRRIQDQAINRNLILFSDVVSPASHTFLSLYRTLSISNNPLWDQLTIDPFLARPSLVSVLNANGAKTVWYSNQPENDWIGSMFGREAQDTHFFGKSSIAGAASRLMNDSEVLPQVLDGIDNPLPSQRVIFFHSYAGHFDYCAHIPLTKGDLGSHLVTSLPFHAVYGDSPVLSESRRKSNVECYLSAMGNVADNLTSTMREMMRSSSPTVLIYSSDHGEDVLDGTGHDSGRPSFRKIEVPMAVFFNDEAKRQYEEEFEFAKANQDKKYNLEWMADSVLDIAGISNRRRRVLSIFGKLEDIPPRYSSLREYRGSEYAISVDGIGDSRGIVKSTQIDLYSKRQLIQAFPVDQRSKICAHRSDSLLKFYEASEAFPCFEVDLVIEPQQHEVYVYHPPKLNSGLPLSVLLDMLPIHSSGVWLDVKNPEEPNLQFLLTYVNQHIAQSRRHSVLIEVSVSQLEGENLNDTFSQIRRDGYGLSYYLPTEEGTSCSEHPGKPECETLKRTVVSALRETPYTSLSFDIKAKRFAVPIATAAGVEMNTWDLDVKSAADIDRECCAMRRNI